MSYVAIISKILANIWVSLRSGVCLFTLPSLFCLHDRKRNSWDSDVVLEMGVAFVPFVRSYEALDKKSTEENLNSFGLKCTFFFRDLLKFVFLEGDKFQIYVILTALRPSRITLAKVHGRRSKPCLSLSFFDTGLLCLLAKMRPEWH